MSYVKTNISNIFDNIIMLIRLLWVKFKLRFQSPHWSAFNLVSFVCNDIDNYLHKLLKYWCVIYL